MHDNNQDWMLSALHERIKLHACTPCTALHACMHSMHCIALHCMHACTPCTALHAPICRCNVWISDCWLRCPQKSLINELYKITEIVKFAIKNGGVYCGFMWGSTGDCAVYGCGGGSKKGGSGHGRRYISSLGLIPKISWLYRHNDKETRDLAQFYGMCRKIYIAFNCPR